MIVAIINFVKRRRCLDCGERYQGDVCGVCLARRVKQAEPIEGLRGIYNFAGEPSRHWKDDLCRAATS